MIIEAPNRLTARVLGACSLLALCASLGACSTPAHRVDAASPIAAQAAAAAADPGPYPRFSDIPDRPADVRDPAAWRSSIAGVRAAGARTNAEAAPSTFTLNDTEGFAERTRRAVAGAGTAPGEEAARAQADAFARTARERAKPPPSTR